MRHRIARDTPGTSNRTMSNPDPRRPRPTSPLRQTRQSALVAVLVASMACGGILALTNADDEPDKVVASGDAGAVSGTGVTDPAAGAAAIAPDPAATSASPADTVAADGAVDLVGDEASADGCTLAVQSTRYGDTGDSVACLQQALTAEGFYSGPINATFDQATDNAVRSLQTDRDLFVDGVVGRESAISLGIWPDEAALVIHTPPPPAGAKDLWGYPLSSVAVSGPDAPPLPPNSGSGKRVVYDRAGQRVWAVDKDGVVIRSYLVAGSKYSNEMPGVHEVYSKSEMSTAWNGKAWLPLMVRYQKTDIGAIGFHAIPIHVNDNTPYMTEAEMGQRLSGGCQRQSNRDAKFMWDFADVGTTVVVI
jgi:peptidoglycan hydrolase-like protein with peptidoglycan-binding domain